MPETIGRIEGSISVLQDDMSHVRETLVAHETRFGNGREVMSEIRTDIEKLQPKAPDWLKLMLAGLSVVGILMGAQLWLTDRFNARPTRGEMDKMTAPIKSAQKETAKEIGDIEKSQSAQQTSIKNIENTQTAQGHKIDTILDRLPARRTHR
jgi:cytoskeletal protein RodZ